MKKLFLGILYIVTVILAFTYYLIPVAYHTSTSDVSLFVKYAYTGIPIVGWIFIFPAFIFAILALCMNGKKIEFLRDVFNFFSALFAIGTILLCVCDRDAIITQPFVLVVLGVCSVILLAGSVYGIVIALLNEKNKKVEETVNE